jgi:LacI family transcriptional regulator
MKQKTSLKDIAKKVGVSIPLVSYVLSNKGKENRVSEKTAEKIRKVAKELNYHPNLSARSLKTNKTKTIGVIVADISNPFFSNLARVIEDEAYSQEYTVIFGSSDENIEKFGKVLNFLQTRQVDGFIIAAPEGSKELLIQLKETITPMVMIDRYFKDLDSAYVIVDNFNASLQATNYLLQKGHQKIASVVYDSQLAHYQDRCDGYLEALKKSEISANSRFLGKVGHLSLRKDMKRIIKKLVFENEIDAIYFHTNTLAEEGLKQLMNLGKDVLNNVDVVVFDQNSTYHFLENFIPYIKQPIKKMGQKSVRMLIDQIKGENLIKSQIQLETKLKTGKFEIV